MFPEGNVCFPVAFHCLYVSSDKESNVRKDQRVGRQTEDGRLPEMEERYKTGPFLGTFCFLSFPNVLPEVNHQGLCIWLTPQKQIRAEMVSKLQWIGGGVCFERREQLFLLESSADKEPIHFLTVPRWYCLQPSLCSVYCSNSVRQFDWILPLFFFFRDT